ncbi:NAD(P)-binding protein [Mycena alexandri]|uniref:NAD(P)-binding protein n=1 Tax=Mycena alexandri TaxID=1745969 RepID=A0AAD6WW04_9AGAR|nr:NAD(P)-binding protein [Mycena alexandri]
MPISSSQSAPLVVVVGSTGIQGGSVIKALAESDRAYRLRGLTRDVTKPAARKLVDQGVEMMNIDLSVENAEAVRREAFAGANIVFMVTNFRDHLDKRREVDEGKMMVQAAMAAGVELLVWSPLESVINISKGKYAHVDHFDGKAEVTDYARQSGIPLVIIPAGWYAINHVRSNAYIPKKQVDGSYVLGLPGIECPAFGPGTEVLASGEDISVREMAVQLGQITGKKVIYKQISDEEFMAATKATPRIALEDLEMMKFYEEFGYFNGKDTTPSRKHLARAPRSWADFVKATDWSSILA